MTGVLLVYHRTGNDGPHAEHVPTPAELRARVFHVPCLECEDGLFELPDGERIPCGLCKGSGQLPVWI